MKKSIGKIILSLFVSFSFLFMLAACGGGENNEKVTLNFYVDGDLYHTMRIDGKSEVTLPENPVKTDYRFDGWYFDNGIFTQEFNSNTLTLEPIKVETNVYAKFTDIANYYTVTFNSNGGSDVQSILNVKEGTKIDEPTSPTKVGYDFEGWYTNEDLTTKWVFNSNAVVSNITLYAKFIKNYEVTYILNYEGASTEVKYTELGKVNYTPTRDGFVFNGWWLSDGSINGEHILTQKYNTNNLVESEGLVLYAEWVEKSTLSSQLSVPVVSINVAEHKLSWDPVMGASGYNVVVYLNGSEVVSETVTDLFYDFNDFDAGNYTVKIRSIGDGVNTINSVYVTKNYAHMTLEATQNIALDLNTARLTWDAVKYATYYEIYVDGVYYDTVEGVAYYDMSSFDAGRYLIKIKACRENYVSSEKSQYIDKLKLAAPTLVAEFNKADKSYTITWEAVAHANKYHLFIDGVKIELTSATYTFIIDSQNEDVEIYAVALDTNADYLISENSERITVSKKYLLTVNKNENTAGSVSLGTEQFVNDYFVAGNYELKANVNEGYNFVGWFDVEDNLLSEELIYIVTLGEDTVVNAKWNYYTVTITVNNDEYAYIVGCVDRKVSVGSNVALEIWYERYDYVVFDGWFDEENNLISKNYNDVFIMPAKNKVITAKFSAYEFKLINSDESAGNLNKSTSYNYVKPGNTVTIYAEANGGYVFTGWYNELDELVSENPVYTYTMEEADCEFAAKWVELDITINKNIEEAGSYELLSGYMKFGSNATVLATNDNGYTFEGWYDENDQLISQNPRLMFLLEMNKSYVFNAKWTYYTLSVEYQEGVVDGFNVNLYYNYEGAPREIYRTLSVTETNGLVFDIPQKRENYIFTGWYLDAACKTRADLTAKVVSDMNMYAGWEYIGTGDERGVYDISEIFYARQVHTIDSYSISINKGSSLSTYLYIYIFKTGTYTITLNQSSGTGNAYYYITNVTTKEKIVEKERLYGFKASYTITANEGDKIRILAYRSTSYGDTSTTPVLSVYQVESNIDLLNSAAGGVASLPKSFENVKYTAGNSVTLYGYCKAGYKFDGWYDEQDNLISNEIIYTFNMPSKNYKLIAKYVSIE